MYERRCETMNGFKVHTSGAHFNVDESGVILSLFGDTCRKAIKLPTLVSYLSNVYEEAKQDNAHPHTRIGFDGQSKNVWNIGRREIETGVSKSSEREQSSSNYLFVIKRSGSLMTTKHMGRFISLRHKFMNFISFCMARDAFFFINNNSVPFLFSHFAFWIFFFLYSSSWFFFLIHFISLPFLIPLLFHLFFTDRIHNFIDTFNDLNDFDRNLQLTEPNQTEWNEQKKKTHKKWKEMET